MPFRFTKPTTSAQVAAYIAVVLFLCMAVIQVGIAICLLPVTIVWGSSQKTHTVQNSLASLAACVILSAMAWIIYRRSQPAPEPYTNTASWIIAFYMVLNTLGNFLSPNAVERFVFGSMTVVLAVCSFVVASSAKLPATNSENVRYEIIA